MIENDNEYLVDPELGRSLNQLQLFTRMLAECLVNRAITLEDPNRCAAASVVAFEFIENNLGAKELELRPPKYDLAIGDSTGFFDLDID